MILMEDYKFYALYDRHEVNKELKLIHTSLSYNKIEKIAIRLNRLHFEATGIHFSNHIKKTRPVLFGSVKWYMKEMCFINICDSNEVILSKIYTLRRKSILDCLSNTREFGDQDFIDSFGSVCRTPTKDEIHAFIGFTP